MRNNPMKAARKRAGRTKEWVCFVTGLSYPTIFAAERGLVSERTLTKVAAVLGVDVDELRVAPAAAPTPEPEHQ